MLKIRLQRIGRRNSPAFRVVVTESTRGPKSGKNVELLGTYNPHSNISVLKNERIKHWIDKGAQISDTVHNIFIKEKVIKGSTINALPKKTPVVKEAESSEESPEVENKESPAEETPGDSSGEEKEVSTEQSEAVEEDSVSTKEGEDKKEESSSEEVSKEEFSDKK